MGADSAGSPEAACSMTNQAKEQDQKEVGNSFGWRQWEVTEQGDR